MGHAVMLGFQAFSNLAMPPDVFGPAGHLLALAGLLGLYRRLGDRIPILTRIAGTVAVVALAGWTLMTVTRLLAVAGVVPSAGDVIPGAVFMLVFVSTVVTYGLFGALTVRDDEWSWLVGIVVAAPGALILVALVASVVADVTAASGVVVGGGVALSVLALGYTLQTWHRPTDRAVPARDVTGG